MDKATGMERDQHSDKSKPTTAVVAEKPLTEAQWVSQHFHIPPTQHIYTDSRIGQG
jgi:hypothetical protein